MNSKLWLSLLVLITSPLSLSLSAAEATDVDQQEVDKPYFHIWQSTFLRMGDKSFRTFYEAFQKAYEKTDFTPTLTNSFFDDTELYDVVGIPVAQTPLEGYQLELFAQLHDPRYSAYRAMGRDSVYYDIAERQLAYKMDKTDIGVGLGFMTPLSPSVNLRSMISSHDIPGYGDSRFVLGLDMKF
ncbi:hypothetical protein [Aliagarivorans taiwanensis]|uniref:hypothetical protein n=1 Tax=Aliagarivorans taiwanensis TaxID=561966 RepID=UPI00041DFF08|nr:hypothetical protein [Aliagarivorans taiwanensis]